MYVSQDERKFLLVMPLEFSCDLITLVMRDADLLIGFEIPTR